MAPAIPHLSAAFESVEIPLDPSDHLPVARLLECFRGFNNTACKDERAEFDHFVSQTPMAVDVDFEEVDHESLSGWWCRPKDLRPGAALLYLHGGGYIRGSATAYRSFASQIAARCRIATFVLEYPLAPEATAPAPLLMVGEALRWLRSNGNVATALVGDSAGGGLALAALSTLDVLALQSIVACVAFSPWTDLTLSGASVDNPDISDPLLSRKALARYAATYIGEVSPHDPRVSPLFGTASMETPLLIQVGSNEILLDDAREFARHAAARGAPVKLEIWKELYHVFQLDLADLSSGRLALDRTAETLMAAFDRVQVLERKRSSSVGRVL
ncbi:monoterpene epsilon-lactone hydrolase [Agrobacterium larrymoorei]|uniref:Monoterpene epsilon-lactone hydrolase n=1 Tax=Agrobacterium larrymoorei TaxID=160699 RepID=A0AAJ2ER51_9HYPH|nr:alpha/beta hydrolase fold domain-containing protein [Agrobacterium larrymoorei]MDR6101741.1 monoterpene epsilon-lactone hydrolase [Agrobacterium larrymoorei]